MRKIYSFLLVVFLFASCSKDENTVLPGMSANIDNVAWNSDSTIVVLNEVRYFSNFYIVGRPLNGISLHISIHGNSIDTFKVEEFNDVYHFSNATYGQALNASFLDDYFATSGEVILTELDTSKNEISGTFYFTMKLYPYTQDSISVANGRFNKLRYTISNGK
jgi:hypothetical protein